MPEASHSGPLAPRHGHKAAVGRSVSRVVLNLGTRVYAVILIAIVLGLSWLAFKYLLTALIFPAKPPPQVVELARRMDLTLLSPQAFSLAGLRAAENPRTPPAHYHGLGAWFQSDPQNGCTVSGCHLTMPHDRNKADRAFLNMHATSIHCGVCHLQTDSQPMELTWYDLSSGARTETPALLRAYGWLTAPERGDPTTMTGRQQGEIVDLLRAAARQAGDDPVLARLAKGLADARAGSGEFAALIEATRETIPLHFRGEYDAKLALVDKQTRRPRLRFPGNEAAVRDYLARGSTLNDTERLTLLAKVHPTRRQPTLNCTQCHTPTGSLVDLPALGYPPARIDGLMRPLVMQAIEHIAAGREFYMPGFMTPPEAPTTRPVPPGGQP